MFTVFPLSIMSLLDLFAFSLSGWKSYIVIILVCSGFFFFLVKGFRFFSGFSLCTEMIMCFILPFILFRSRAKMTILFLLNTLYSWNKYNLIMSILLLIYDWIHFAIILFRIFMSIIIRDIALYVFSYSV